MDYEVTVKDKSVFFEHNEYGEDLCVKFWVKDKVIYDYEYCSTPPSETEKWMLDNGYTWEDE